MFAKLRKQGLVSSSRGPGGGYKLSRDSDDITVLDVIAAVDEKVDSTACEGKGNCHGEEHCLSHELWTSLSEQIKIYLSGISLGKVVRDYEKSKRNDKVITFDLAYG